MKNEGVLTVNNVNVKGKMVRFSGNDKAIYMYMKKQYEYYLSFGKMYYDNLEEIADAVGVSKSTLQRSIDKMCRAGIIIKTVHHGMNRKSNSYVVKEM